jgi:hypothetical protein
MVIFLHSRTFIFWEIDFSDYVKSAEFGKKYKKFLGLKILALILL